MDTLVEVLLQAQDEGEAQDAVDRALSWFVEVERVCSRFDPESELARACAVVGRWTPVSTLLAETVGFALQMAEASGGAFDPTIGYDQVDLGFTREYRTGARYAPAPPPARLRGDWRDVKVDPAAPALKMERPALLDLGGVAKGLALDLAARELDSAGRFAIDAGGDVRFGSGPGSKAWRIGVAHPLQPQAIIAAFDLSDAAVCSSGTYERTNPDGRHHLLDARTKMPPPALAGMTVIAPTAMLADAASTAAAALGPYEGISWLRRQALDGFAITTEMEVIATSDWVFDAVSA
jgi:thiamine biosynthesis lipoprotein